jgi:hypothetical protein
VVLIDVATPTRGVSATNPHCHEISGLDSKNLATSGFAVIPGNPNFSRTIPHNSADTLEELISALLMTVL